MLLISHGINVSAILFLTTYVVYYHIHHPMIGTLVEVQSGARRCGGVNGVQPSADTAAASVRWSTGCQRRSSSK